MNERFEALRRFLLDVAEGRRAVPKKLQELPTELREELEAMARRVFADGPTPRDRSLIEHLIPRPDAPVWVNDDVGEEDVTRPAQRPMANPNGTRMAVVLFVLLNEASDITGGRPAAIKLAAKYFGDRARDGGNLPLTDSRIRQHLRGDALRKRK